METLLALAALVIAAFALNRASRAEAELGKMRRLLDQALKPRAEKQPDRQHLDDEKERWAPARALYAQVSSEKPSAIPGVGDADKPAQSLPQEPRAASVIQAKLPEPSELKAPAAQEPAGVKQPPPLPVPPPRVPAAPDLDVERFMGAKLFAWIGGLALFLGVLFFVKLSFERGWISPALRISLGLLCGVGLMMAGVLTQSRQRYAVLGQTLCATGVVMLYGVSFAAHALYQLGPFASPSFTFATMSAVTAVAFLLAVRMEARVVAVLGMLGGFLTPPLCSTGQDQVLALFGYITLLDLGVLAVVRHRRWLFLAPLTALGTVWMQWGWLFSFMDRSGYAYGAATWVPIAVFLGFGLLFTAAVKWVGEGDDEQPLASRAALIVLSSAMLAALVFLSYGSISTRPLVLFSFLFGIHALALATLWMQPRQAWAHAWIVGLVFLHLAAWTFTRLNAGLLYWALGGYLVFGLLITGFSVAWQRRGLETRLPAGWMPMGTLVLALLSVLRLETVGLGIWPVILLVDLLIIVLAARSGSVLPVFAALVMTLLTAGVWLFHMPARSDAWHLIFLTLTAMAGLLFSAAGAWLMKKLPQNAEAGLLPGASAIMPFVLLILATLTMDMPDPSPVFAVALLLVLIQLALARWTMTTQTAAAALICSGVLQSVWHAQHFSVEWPVVPLLWALAFHLVFITHHLCVSFPLRLCIAEAALDHRRRQRAGGVRAGASSGSLHLAKRLDGPAARCL